MGERCDWPMIEDEVEALLHAEELEPEELEEDPAKRFAVVDLDVLYEDEDVDDEPVGE